MKKKDNTDADLKDTTDVHSRMARSIAQCYLRVVLNTHLSEDETIRQIARTVAICILEQDLVRPDQFIPYLIAMPESMTNPLKISTRTIPVSCRRKSCMESK